MRPARPGRSTDQLRYVVVRQDTENRSASCGTDISERIVAGSLLAKIGDDLALGARLGFDERLGGLFGVQRGKDGLLFLAGELLEGVGEVLAGQFGNWLRVTERRHLCSVVTASSSDERLDVIARR